MKLFQLITLMIFCGPLFVSAETVYNFYFNPETVQQKEPVKSQTAPQTESTPKTKMQRSTLFCLNEYFGFDCEDKIWRISARLTSFMGANRGGDFKLGDYEVQIGEKKNKKRKNIGLGATLAAKYYPAKYFGFFVEGVYFDQDQNDEVTLATGTEVIPLHLSLFGVNELIEVGGEIGWSSLKDWNLENGRVGINRERIAWFGGVLSRVNISDDFSVDFDLRKSFSRKFWMTNAGLSYKF